MCPNIAKCPLRGEITPVESHCSSGPPSWQHLLQRPWRVGTGISEGHGQVAALGPRLGHLPCSSPLFYTCSRSRSSPEPSLCPSISLVISLYLSGAFSPTVHVSRLPPPLSLSPSLHQCFWGSLALSLSVCLPIFLLLCPSILLSGCSLCVSASISFAICLPSPILSVSLSASSYFCLLPSLCLP